MGTDTVAANGVASNGSIPNGIANGVTGRAAAANENANTLREMTADGLLKRIQEMKEDVLEHFNGRVNDIMSEIRQRTETCPEGTTELTDNVDKYRDKRQSTEKGILPDKEFLERNSLLTDLFQISHIRTVYNMFVVIFILLFLNTVANDIIDTNRLYIGTFTIRAAFKNLPSCFYIWLSMQISTMAVYYAFNLWAHRRLEFASRSLIRTWDYWWLAVLIIYKSLFVVLPTKALLDEDLGIACSIIVLMEQVRLIMKSYAFLRSTAPRFLTYKPHSEVARPVGPAFTQYLYFLFVPTLIYRDSYPRTKRIRWTVVATHLAEVVLVVFYYAFILERMLVPVYRVFGKQSLDWRWCLKSMLGAMLPGILCFTSGFYMLLHAWMNAWAEMLRFADRLFYKDWWNCTSFRTYYRNWNIVVHDWLFTYIYKDMYEIVVPGNRVLSTAAVFLVSSIVHEYILVFVFRFFYPVLLLMFGGLGFALIFARRAANIFMLLGFCIGTGIIFSLYTMEYYARINCPPHQNEFLDLLLPRSWTCYRQFSG